jgi:hypothetical protein
MPIPPTASLAEQLHCLSHDGTVVITAQRWTEPRRPTNRPRTWLRLVRNGRVMQDVPFTGQAAHLEMRMFWDRLIGQYEPTGLDEDQMWNGLRELTQIEQTECGAKDCVGRLPVAWWYCPLCRRDTRRVASGSLIAARGRGVITLDMRKRQS